jgi:flagellar hook protein FlgE
VRTAILQQNDIDGAFRGTGRETNLAISGSGCFVVTRGPRAGGAAEPPLLTRTGSFEPDANGNLRNAAGLYLAGYRYDDTGALGLIDRNSFTGLETVNVGNATVAGSPTAAITVAGNLPSQETGQAVPGAPFLSSVEYYTPLGAAGRLQMSWQPGATANQWTMTLSDTNGTDYGSVTVDFHDSGPLAGAPMTYSGVTNLATAPAAFAFNTATGAATLTLDNGTAPQVIDLALGTPDSYDGLSQFSGDYTPLQSVPDGSQSGTMIRVEIDERGDIWGFFDNGARRALFNVPLAEVTNPNGLSTQDNNTFVLTRDSGTVQMSIAATGGTGAITSGGVESSNVDIAEELTELIQKQRAYSSNAKVITTADEMLDETMRLKR